MAYHGTISEFQSGSEDWVSYTERLEYYFEANDIADGGKKRSILLTACGLSTLKLIKGLLGDKVKTTEYTAIIEAVTNYYVPAPFPIVQRYRFNSRVRDQGETITQFVTALRQLSEHCEYGESLDQMLRDRLVCGVNHEGIQRKLLAAKELNYKRAYELATSVEVAERNSKDLRNSNKPFPTESVHYSFRPSNYSSRSSTSNRSIRNSPQPSGSSSNNEVHRSVTCYRCGGPHLAPECKYQDAVCRYCKKKDHLQQVCRTKLGMSSRTVQNSTTDPVAPTNTNRITTVSNSYTSNRFIDRIDNIILQRLTAIPPLNLILMGCFKSLLILQRIHQWYSRYN